MGALISHMTHEQAVEHLQRDFLETVRNETGRLLVAPPAFFGAVRAIMCDLDYVSALYYGWDRGHRRKISTPKKSKRFLKEIFPPATSEPACATFAQHLYEMFRVGTVHLRAPKQVKNPNCSTPVLSWGLMEDRTETFDYPYGGPAFTGTHLCPVAVSSEKTILPVSIRVLFEDFVKAVERFAMMLEAERLAGGSDLLNRWQTVANAVITPEPSRLRW